MRVARPAHPHRLVNIEAHRCSPSERRLATARGSVREHCHARTWLGVPLAAPEADRGALAADARRVLGVVAVLAAGDEPAAPIAAHVDGCAVHLADDAAAAPAQLPTTCSSGRAALLSVDGGLLLAGLLRASGPATSSDMSSRVCACQDKQKAAPGRARGRGYRRVEGEGEGEGEGGRGEGEGEGGVQRGSLASRRGGRRRRARAWRGSASPSTPASLC